MSDHGHAWLYLNFFFRLGNRAEVFVWENFQRGCIDLGRRDLGKWIGPPSNFMMNTSKFLQRRPYVTSKALK